MWTVGMAGGWTLAMATLAHADPLRTVTSEGVCSREITPDRARVRATSEVIDRELAQATRRAGEQYERVKRAVERLGLESLELTTTEYQVSEVREWEKDRSVFKGFRARVGLEVSTAQVARLGEVIAIASREGVRDVGALQSYLSPTKRAAEESKCLAVAAEDARARAIEMARALGVSVGAAQQIEALGGASLPPAPPLLMMRAESAGAAMAPPTIEAGRESLSARVRVVFALK